jgi:phage shock protein E
MMLVSRRIASLAIFSANAFLSQTHPSVAFASPPIKHFPFGVTKLTTAKAAPGITIAAPEEIRNALSNPKTTVVDARKVDEILEAGYLKTPNNQWVHAPCTLEECPLLSVAAESLVRDPLEPVVVYCASGKRANVAKEFLEGKGYKQVLNAGGYPDDMHYLLKK